jgi:glycosyltransferase involved in cell wall biosynthesis
MIGYSFSFGMVGKAERSLGELMGSSRGVMLHGAFDVTSMITWRMYRKGMIPRYAVVPHGALDPWVFTYHVYRKRLWLRLFGRRLIKHAAVVICASESEKSKLLALCPEANCAVCHWGVPDNYHRGSKVEDREKINICFGIPAGKRLVVMIGRISWVKQFARSAQLFLSGDLADDHHLLIVGIPEERDEAMELDRVIADSRGSITLVPPQYGQRKDEIYNAADVFLNISRKESFSFTTVESLSFDVPVVISDGIGIFPALAPYGCSRVVPVEVGPSQFREAIRSTASSPGRPRQAYLECFTQEMFARNIGRLVNDYFPQ